MRGGGGQETDEGVQQGIHRKRFQKIGKRESSYRYRKEDLRECMSWRAITLLSTPGKVMTVISLNRIRNAVDGKLRQEQAGFRPGRSCCEQIFTLRQIIRKVVGAKQVPVLINFIDFKKTFDSVHRG